jgi:Tol biopolymer transport system component
MRVALTSLILVIALSGTSLAGNGGFNVNADVTLVPIPSTYRTISSTTGCPAGFAGKFTFTALLTNKPTGAAMPGVTVRVVILTNGNVLQDPQTGAVLGGSGAVMAVPKLGQFADGLLSAGEQVSVPFVVCLKTIQQFQFFVDLFGIVTQLVSVNSQGIGSSGSSEPSQINHLYFKKSISLSADGRFVAFTSRGSNLVTTPDTNQLLDVFVRDLLSGKTVLASVNHAGTSSGNGESLYPSLSANGRFVAFTSRASDLVANDTNGTTDLFVQDLNTGTTRLVGVNVNTGARESAVFSADGRFIAFTSGSNVFVHDLPAGVTTSLGMPSTDPAMSADGRIVAFLSGGSVFVQDLQMGTTALVSGNRFGTGNGNGPSQGPLISANGRFVLFVSLANDLVLNDTNAAPDVFVRDLQTGVTALVSANLTGTGSGNAASGFFRPGIGSIEPPVWVPTISADGRFVAFMSAASDLVTNDTNGTLDLFVRDLQTQTTTRVAGAGSSNLSRSLSADGHFLVFVSGASDLVAGDNNGQSDIFVRDLQAGITSLISVNRTGTNGGNSFSLESFGISADGRVVAFTSRASDLVANDTNGDVEDVFVRPVL